MTTLRLRLCSGHLKIVIFLLLSSAVSPISINLSVVIIHLNLLLDLLKQALTRILAQIEGAAELLNNLNRVVVLEDLDFFDVLAVELNLEHADWYSILVSASSRLS